MPEIISDRDDPRKIANYLVQEYGVEGAFQAAFDGIERRNSNGNFYALSVWSEVRRLLKTNE